jgi:peptidoglycan hydrolase-like protein with peptidoglycan-binding domain
VCPADQPDAGLDHQEQGMARILRDGDQGADVRAVQDALNFQIRRLDRLAVDGRFGQKTLARVAEFQRANGLAADGIVGPVTGGRLFQTEQMPVLLRLSPNAQASSLTTPRLIPPLTLPGLPPGFPVLSPIQLFPSGTARLPPLTAQGQLLTLRLTVPARNDPLDPTLRSQQQVLQLLQSLPANFPFRAAIVGAVPQPVKIDGVLGKGFKWGVDPVFDVTKVAAPAEFKVGVKGNARYTLQLVASGPGGLKIGWFVAGDFKATIDYTSSQATSRPLFQFQGMITTGLGGFF